MRSAVAVVLILAGAAWAYADCPGSSVEPADVVALLRPTQTTELDAEFRQRARKHYALTALFHYRRLMLHRTRSEEIRYLNTLPRTQQQLDQVYELTFARDICDDHVISETVYGMFDIAAKLVRRHGIRHRQFINLCLFANAEVGEVAWPAFDMLLQADPKLTVAALRQLSGPTRRRICGGSDPRELSLLQAVRRCQSGL